MRNRVVLAIAAITAGALIACGGASVPTPATGSPPQAATEASGATEASDDATLTLTTEPQTSPAELRESMQEASEPSRVPIAQLPPPAARPAVTAASPVSESPPPRAIAAGEPHAAPPSVSSDPVGEHLITTVFEVDTAGEVHVRHAR
ncbi:MAG: hypothetical protein DRJ42_27400 [Deltaproteobacteria bacterium]|nr:MAG: hypothetical protein DRJ42_27400 [Deltaproteobacteria bacterium]